MSLSPRPYQTAAIDELRGQIRAGQRRLLLVSGTGTGKTVIASLIINGAVQRNRRILFLAHRMELIDQTSQKLDDIGVDHGVLQATHWRTRPWMPVQVASVMTLIRRQLQNKPDLIIIDECHRARSASYVKIIENYPDAVLLGLTATPIRSDGKGLGALFDVMVECPPISEMIEQGHLVPIETWTHPAPNLRGVDRRGTDYDIDQLATRMNQAKLLGDIVRHWHKHARDRQTVAFAVNIEHSKAITQRFVEAGVRAEHLDGDTPPNLRRAILRRLANRETQLVSNCGVLTEGWDCPIVSCVILDRPTLSMGLFLQMAGRALRPAPGKENCLILDHAGCVLQHGLVEEDRTWVLTEDRIFNRKRANLADTVKVCPKCRRACAITIRMCPGCGYEFSTSKKQDLREHEGDLVRAEGQVVTEAQRHQRQRQFTFWLHQEKYGFKKDGSKFKRGYANARFHGQYGIWPPRHWRDEWEALQRKTA